LFHTQGLEFANFILNNETKALEQNLSDVISNVVDASAVIPQNKQKVKTALAMTIREIIYQGSPKEKLYLERLSKTYMMLFLLQVDPKVTHYFDTLASQTTVFVGTSILIPALSEKLLEPQSRRYSNLLTGAKNAGVRLIINDDILNELAGHFKKIKQEYEKDFKNFEQNYLTDEIRILYIKSIMIRAYFYSKYSDKVSTFYDFLNNFLNPSLKNAKENLVQYLKHQFGIEYIPNKNLKVDIDEYEASLLFDTLKQHKNSENQAKSDTNLILTIHALRAKNDETLKSGIFGYKTWWLTKETQTQKAIEGLFDEKYEVSCYIRPDFLYNYIALAPNKADTDKTYERIFPSLLGVHIGFHIPPGIQDFVNKRIKEFDNHDSPRMSAILRDLIHHVKTDPNFKNRATVEHWFDEQLKTISFDK